MAEPLLYLLPERHVQETPGVHPIATPQQPQPFTLEVPPIARRQARITRTERSRFVGWGDLNAPRLVSVLRRAEDGDVADWYDLCEFAVRDPGLGSLYATRLDRVAQAELVIRPNPFGNPREAELAAEFCNEQLGRIENWSSAKRKLLHAVASGFSAGELMLEYDDVKHTPSTTPTNYVKTIEWVHGHRFRYDEQWNLRLYDRGMKRSKASIYGEALIPHKWAIHQYTQVAGYPGLGGLMASCIWEWMFMRWAEKWWIGGTERNGGPFIWASVSENLDERRKQDLLDDLEQFTSDRFAVFELPSKPEIEAAAAAARSHEAYVDYQTHHEARQAKLWLGASDIADPGSHGSQSAVSARGAMTTDPRMVTDASLFGESMQATLLRAMIAHNPHKFGVPVSQVPVPEMVLKTADDQIKQDATGRAYEVQAEAEADAAQGLVPAPAAAPADAKPAFAEADPNILYLLPEKGAQPAAPPAASPAASPATPTSPASPPSGAPTQSPSAPPAGDVQKQALNGAQVTSLLEVLRAVASGELPRATGVEVLVTAFNVDRASAEQMMGTVGTPAFEPKEEPPKPNPFTGEIPEPPPPPPKQSGTPASRAAPKVSAPVQPGRQPTTTRATTGRSRSLTATGLRSGSGASASSSSKPRPQQLKL